jgi:hypothetical protein
MESTVKAKEIAKLLLPAMEQIEFLLAQHMDKKGKAL